MNRYNHFKFLNKNCKCSLERLLQFSSYQESACVITSEKLSEILFNEHY